MILLRNFYVGISSWNRYVLDTLTGGNFLGTPALEACQLIESLVGVPPINYKTEITLENVMERLNSLEKSLPTDFADASQINESIEKINKRITALEASNTHDNRSMRIGKLEEAMETLSSTFSSLGFKKEKAFVGKEQKFMYVPKVPKPKLHNMFKNALHVGTSTGGSKMPISASFTLDEVIDLDASSLDNT
jgi:hypothetical protein